MSPRAACRLEALGFERVFDYVPDKEDWLARGLPSEGQKAVEQHTGDIARDDVATARVDERVGDVRPRVEASPYRFAFVVSEDGTLLGRLRRDALEREADARVEEAMEPGPSTVHAHVPLDTLRGRL